MSLELLRQHTDRKLEALIRQVDEIAGSDFPHDDSAEALVAVKAHLEGRRAMLGRLPQATTDAVLKQLCSQVAVDLVQLMPVLGFVLRSTNVRNSFESFHPLRQMVANLLGENARLVLSAEWDFSPLTYALSVSQLPNFVLIGLPASESHNALIVSLAGHELGHSIWRARNLEQLYRPRIFASVKDSVKQNWARFQKTFSINVDESRIDDLEVLTVLNRAVEFAVRQAQEIFCDVVGMRLFGVSFLYAFEYLLAPNIAGYRHPSYPKMGDRVEYILKAGEQFGYAVPSQVKEAFEDEPAYPDSRDVFLTETTDGAARGLFGDLIAQCQKICTEASAPIPSAVKSNDIERSFRMGVPADGVNSLADIINAAWALYRDPSWRAGAKSEDRIAVISEMVFKCIEVSEYTQKISS